MVEPTRPSIGGLRALAPILMLLAVLALVPPVAAGLGNPFLVKIGTRVVVFAVAAAGLNLVLGFGGMVSLLHACLFGIGGYVVAILSFHDFNTEALLGLQGTSNLLISLPLAMIIAGLAAALMGIVSLRTSGSYFIMITLAFNQMLYYFFVSLQHYGGEDGLQIQGTLNFPGFDVGNRNVVFYICLAVLALVLAGLQRVTQSRFGMVLRASAHNERRVTAIGIAPLRYKLAAFAISGAIAGLAGALQAMGQQFISPADLSWVRSGDLVVMCVMGGLATVWGPVVGAAVFLLLELVLSSYSLHWQLPFGLIIIGLAVFLRGGLTDLIGLLKPRTKAAL